MIRVLKEIGNQLLDSVSQPGSILNTMTSRGIVFVKSINLLGIEENYKLKTFTKKKYFGHLMWKNT